MKTINLGKTEKGEIVSLDFEKEGMRFVFLAGASGSGKSVFARNIYRQLVAGHTPKEIGFLMLDMTVTEEVPMPSEYLVQSLVTDPEKALVALEAIEGGDKTLFIHVEECDMVYRDRIRFENVLKRLKNGTKGAYLVFSTSRIDPDYLVDWLERYIDLKVVFRVANEADSLLLLGNDSASHFAQPGEYIVAWGDTQVKCLPLEVSK